MTIPDGNVLVLAPHADDGELGCGATVAKLIEDGYTVHYVAFSICEESVPEGFPDDVLATEVKSATAELGIPSENLTVKDYRVRWFPTDRQEILEELVRLNRELEPVLVFTPSSFDVHQDHQVVFAEARRAFKKTSILGYEFSWNNYFFGSTMFSVVSEAHIERKVRAIKHYESQYQRLQDIDRLVSGQASFRGVQIGEPYAEAFEVIRWILR